MATPFDQTISILGGGWVGLALARHLHAQGYAVNVSRTTAAGAAELRELGLAGFELTLPPHAELPDSAFWQVPTVVVTVPPQRGVAEAEQLAQFGQLLARAKASGVRHLLYISSTSVYGDAGGEVTEADAPAPATPNGHLIVRLEQLLLQEPALRTTVLRFGGLIGYDRLPTSGEAILRRQRALDTPMNVVHRDDCVRIIHEIVRQKAWGEVFNACADEHPTRRAYYAAAARARGFALPELGPVQVTPYKVVSSAKLKSQLGYQFVVADPLAIFTAPTALGHPYSHPHGS